MAQRPKQIHGTHIREGLDKAFLGSAFAAGATGVIGLKLYGAEIWWPAAFSALVLIAYALSTWFNRNLSLEPEVIGDNCYYLGFLFTLISLGMTLYQMGGAGAEASILRDVISGFGVALSSTIVGIFLRVWMMQLRTDVVSRDRQARLELNDAGREFRQRLLESASHIKAFSTEAVQLAGETNSRIHKANETFHAEHRALIAETAQQHSKALSDQLAASSAIITRDLKAGIEEVLSEFRTEVSTSLVRLGKVTEETVRMHEAEAKGQSSRMAEAVEETRRSHETLQAWNALLDQLKLDTTNTSEAMQGASKKLADGVGRAITDVEAAARQAEVVLSLKDLGPALERPVAALAQAAERIEAVVRAIEHREVSIWEGCTRLEVTYSSLGHVGSERTESVFGCQEDLLPTGPLFEHPENPTGLTSSPPNPTVKEKEP